MSEQLRTVSSALRMIGEELNDGWPDGLSAANVSVIAKKLQACATSIERATGAAPTRSDEEYATNVRNMLDLFRLSVNIAETEGMHIRLAHVDGAGLSEGELRIAKTVEL